MGRVGVNDHVRELVVLLVISSNAQECKLSSSWNCPFYHHHYLHIPSPETRMPKFATEGGRKSATADTRATHPNVLKRNQVGRHIVRDM